MLSDPGLIIEKLQEVHNFFLAKKEKAISDNIRNLDLYLYLCNVANEGIQRILAVSIGWKHMYHDLDLENDHLIKRIFHQYERKPYGDYFKNDYCISLAQALINIELNRVFSSSMRNFREDSIFMQATASYCDSTGLFEDYDYEADARRHEEFKKLKNKES